MLKVILAALLAAVILFFWNFVSWTMLPLHNMTTQSLNIGDETAQWIQNQHSQPGVYYYPAMPDMTDSVAMSAYTQRHEAGPVISMMVLLPDGAEVMAPMMFVWSLVFYFISALIGILLLRQTGGVLSYGGRVLYFTVLGLFASLVADVPMSIWMYVPVVFTVVMMLDLIIGWFLAGLVMSVLVKPARQAA